MFGTSCELVLAKELTKTFERFVTGCCKDIKDWLLMDVHHIKGEFVLIIPPQAVQKEIQLEEHVLSVLLTELPLKQAVKLACLLTNSPKNELYQMALTLRPAKDS